jgi:hypothetical protein
MAYEKDKDYQSLINDAVASGDYKNAAEYEKLRNEKIAGEGITQYAPTYKYTTNPNGAGTTPAAAAPATDYHKDAINAAQAYSSGSGDWQAVLDAINNRNQKVQATGNDYGKSSIDILNELMGTYKYPTDMNGIIAQLQKPVEAYGGNDAYDIASRILAQLESGTYGDWTQGDAYKALAQRYSQNGNSAMQNTLGQISSRTGGLASSYATTAAQQQYNAFMAQLEEAARAQYGDERNDLLENANLAMNMGDTEYRQYLDQQNRQSSNQGAAIQAIMNMMGYYTGQEDTAHERQQYDDETSYNRGQTAKTDAQNRIYDYLVNQGGSVGNLGAELITASGYTTAELNAMEAKYQQNMAASAAKSSGGGSGGGSSSGGGSKSSGATKPTLTAAQTLAAINGGIINDTTKAAYE